MKKHRLAWGVGLVSSVLLISGCSSPNPTPTDTTGGPQPLVVNGEMIADADTYAAAKAEGVLDLYTAYLEEAADKFAADFTSLTGIQVNVIRLTPTQLIERALAEAGANMLGADVIQTSDPGNNTTLENAGMIKCDILPTLYSDQMDPGYLDPSGCAYPGSVSAMVIMYNSAQLGDVAPPATWQDLTKPEYKGMLGLLTAGTGGSAWSNYMYLRNQYGLPFWQALAAQNPSIQTSNAILGPQIERGEVTMGIVSASTAEAGIATGAPVKLVLPSDGLAVYANYTLLSNPAVEKSPHPNAAMVFRNWFFSAVGQESVVLANGGMWSVRSDSPAPPDLPAYADLHMIVPDLQQWQSLQDQWVQDWNSVFNYQPQ